MVNLETLIITRDNNRMSSDEFGRVAPIPVPLYLFKNNSYLHPIKKINLMGGHKKFFILVMSSCLTFFFFV